MKVPDKHYAFITSAGRTGTRFLGEKLGQMIPEAFSVHEPDVLTLDLKDNIRKIRKFGVDQMLWKRFLGKSGIRNLSQQLISGKSNEEETWHLLLAQRANYWNEIPEELIIESYSGWFGLLPLIRKNLMKYRIAIITRHPADWIRSAIQWESLYGKRDWVNILGRERLNPSMLGDKEHVLQWKNYEPFEKLCWAWAATYGTALENENEDKDTAVFKYEELFHPIHGKDKMNELLKHICSYDDKSFHYKMDELELKQRIHENKNTSFPPFEKWTDEMKATMLKHCASVMKKAGYDLN